MTPGYVLDSDVASLLTHYPNQQPHLVQKVSAMPIQQMWISIVTIEEAIKGAFALINNPKMPTAQIQSCELLRRIMQEYSRFRILPYDATAQQVYKNMTAAEKRVGTNDCKIAAIAMSRNFVVVTRNVRDFTRINGVVFEDWTQP